MPSMSFVSLLLVIAFGGASAFAPSSVKFASRVQLSALSKPLSTETFLMADENKDKTGFDWLNEVKEKIEKDDKPKPPPFYEPGQLPQRAIAAAAYIIPVVDAADLGKYIFAAYPQCGEFFTTLYGPLAAVYNGVPFLPFAVFFLMSYVARAPTFPVEIRFHFAQAFFISLIQVIPSLALPFLEKASVPYMNVIASSVYLWVFWNCFAMQSLILTAGTPLSRNKNPFVLNVLSWSLKFMNYSKDMQPRR